MIRKPVFVFLLAANPALCLFAPALYLLAPVPARADDAMTAAADNFYAVVTAPGFSAAGIPDAAGRARLAPLLTPQLNQALAAAASAQTRFITRNKGAPPLLAGDIFSSLFEGPTAWKVENCNGDTQTAHCSIGLTRQAAGQQPVRWTDTLTLSNQGGWKVEDVAYDAHFALGNTGTLSQMLKMAQSEAP